MFDDDKPDLDEALLEHHGVKGMRWGHVKSRVSSAAKTAGAAGTIAGVHIPGSTVVRKSVADAKLNDKLRGKAPTVKGQAQARATKMTQRQINKHNAVRDGKGILKPITAIDRATWGRNGRFEAMHNKKIGQLEKSQERIDNGELIARTILFGPTYSRTNKK